MTNKPPAPVIIRSRKSLPLIWIVPLIALVVGGWLIARNSRDHGPEIIIRFQNGAGIEPGKTILEHKGVAVGAVQSVDLDEKLDGVLVKVQLAKNAASLARADSEFWLVRPEIGFSGIKGLDTLFSGPRLKVRPGTGGQPATEFVGLRRAPLLENSDRGRSFVLRSDKLGALTPGAPIFFREMKVGFVETHKLTPNADGVLVRIRIRTPYDQLVRTDTKFWNSGGVSVKVGLLGAEIRSNSLESLITGGVAFATPETPNSQPANEGTEFILADEMDKDWLKWKPKIPITESTEGWETSPAEPEPTN
ncbi:intermembrane transport protein PqiB [Oleiharenicola lentus]|uniref:PqiB family protein n=1 Tax=Oleiharenicola lentus TaxID=2508720 RepID=UPI003F664D28